MSAKPRRHSVVTLRLTVTPDEVFSEDFRRDSSASPTIGMRNRNIQRSRHGRQATSPLCRTPTSPICWSPSSPMSRSPTSPRTRTPTTSRPASPRSPTLPLRRECSSPLPSGRSMPSPISPRSNRLFRYDSALEPKNLRRRSSLLTVPSAHDPPVSEHVYRTPRQRSSSIAGPLRPPDLTRYLNETALIEKNLKPTTSCSSVASNDGTETTSPSLNRKIFSISPEQSTTSLYSPIKRRHSYFTESPVSGHRLRQFSTTSRGSIVNKGDSIRPKRSASNTSVTSTMSSTSRERALSQDSITPLPTPVGSRATTPVGSRGVTPSPTANSTPQYHIAMVGSVGVGRGSLVTQFMTSEYMSAYEDCTDESGSERSVSVILDGEEAELLFFRVPELKSKTSGSPEANSLDEVLPSTISSSANIDAWVVVYSIADRPSYREASAALGRLWTKGSSSTKAIILVGNKTDLARARAVSTTEGRTLARTYECKFIEVSAGIAHNVDELLVGILAQIRLKMKANKPSESCRSTCRRMSEKLKPKNSFRVKGFLGKMISKGKRSRSCENLHML